MTAQCKGGVTKSHGNRLTTGATVGDDAHGFTRQKADFDQAQNDMLLLGRFRRADARNDGRYVKRQITECSLGGGRNGDLIQGEPGKCTTPPLEACK